MAPAGPGLTREEYATLVEQAPIMVWRAGQDAACDYFNARWYTFTGRSPEQERGHGWAEGVHPEDLDRCIAHYMDYFRRRAAFEMEYRLRRHDGAWRWIFDRGSPFWGPDGSFQGYIGSCVDITDRIEAQQALAAAQEKLINTLHGLLPICMVCRKIKDDRGYWEALERYVADHADVSFTHGLCPECYPQYVEGLRKEVLELKRQG